MALPCGAALQGGGRKLGGPAIKSGTSLSYSTNYRSSQQWRSSHTRGPSQQRPRPNAWSSSQQRQQHSQGWQNYNQADDDSQPAGLLQFPSPAPLLSRKGQGCIGGEEGGRRGGRAEEDNQPFVPDKTNRSLNRLGCFAKQKQGPLNKLGSRPHLQPNKVSLSKAQQAERRELRKKLNSLQQAYLA